MANRHRTLADLVADVRNRSGLEANTFRSDSDIARYLNEAGYKLTGLIISNFPDAMFLYKSGTISAVSGTSAYDLPGDCFQPYALRVTLDGRRIDIPRADIDDLDIEVSDAGWSQYGHRPAYRMMGYGTSASGLQVVFMPTPTASYTVTVHYIPALPFADKSAAGSFPGDGVEDMSSDADHAFMSQWGWESWLVIEASIMIKNDQEEDATTLKMERGEWWDIISNQIKSREGTSAPQVRDYYAAEYRKERDYRYR